MAASFLCLYLSMLSHYSAFWFAAALGLYALFRFFTARTSPSLVIVWAVGQLGALALAIFLYKTHISKLGIGESRTALQGWMSEFFLRRSYFDSAHENPLVFLIGHSFGVFQYFFGQLAVGDLMGLLFVVGVVLLLLGKGFSPEIQSDSRRLGIFLLLPFAIAGGASLAHVYPYGGTRHIAFLIIPGVAGVSVAIARLAGNKWPRGLAVAAFIVAACIAFGKTRSPRIDRADQSRRHMTNAMEFVRQDINPSDIIFVDYQSDLILGHYLCQQRPISFESALDGFEQFSCKGHHVISRGYEAWRFSANNFPEEWQRFRQAYRLNAGSTIWIFQSGWDVDLPQDLRRHVAEFHDLQFESFGKNIFIFKLIVGQSMPATAHPAGFISPVADSIPEPAK
jgi:hypothetical protein